MQCFFNNSTFRKKLEELKTELDDLKAVLDSNEDTGKKQSGMSFSNRNDANRVMCGFF